MGLPGTAPLSHPTPILVSSVPSKENSPFLLFSAYIARKQDDEQSNLTSVKPTCKSSKSQIPIVLLRVALELTSGY